MEIEKISQNENKFIFSDIDPSLGNLIHKNLLKDPNIEFAAYSRPHPLETTLIFHLKTSNKSPREIMISTINLIVSDISIIQEFYT